MKFKKNIKINHKQFKIIRDAFLKSSIFPRITCLIVHGSSLYYKIESKSERDIDLELILNKPHPRDYFVIKEILDKVGLKIECQLRYLDEIKLSQSMIHITSYKIFMFFAYSNGHCLIGDNIYKKLVKKISNKKIKQSLLISAQIGFKDIRKSFFAGHSNYSINKNIARTLVCICMYEGFLDYREIGNDMFFSQEKIVFAEEIIEGYRDYLDSQNIREYQNFIKCYQKDKLCENFFPVINKIMNIFQKRAFEK